MSIRTATAIYWRTITSVSLLGLFFLLRMIAEQAAVSFMKPFWDWMDNNMIAVSLAVCSVLFAVYQFDKRKEVQKRLDAYEFPDADISIRDAIIRVKSERKDWRDRPDHEVADKLFSAASFGNLKGWGVDKKYGKEEWEQPIPIEKEFFIKCAGQPEGQDEFWVMSRTVNKRYICLLFNRKQLDNVIAKLPRPSKF